MASIAFLTMRNTGGFVAYDELAIPPLEQLGHTVEFVVWDDPGIAWQAYDLVVIRTPWDYQHQASRFLGVLDEIEDAGVDLANPASVCRWNIHKRYLEELGQRNLPVVPTAFFRQWPEAGVSAIREALDDWDAQEFVIKPTVGASAQDTFRLDPLKLQASSSNLSALFADREFMLQPFLENIPSEGEYSLFYFNGEYSHAILKTPKTGDFRVQEEYGGHIQAVNPEAALRKASDEVVVKTAADLLYARVDLVRWQGDDFRLIELELIEPSLYFPYDEASPQQFAAAIDRRIASQACANV